MIRMTRVRLINWHNFIDNTIEFKTISYMIGEDGRNGFSVRTRSLARTAPCSAARTRA